MSQRISRRAVIAGAGFAALAGSITAPSARAVSRTARRMPLDLTTPVGNVSAYLKLRASLETQDVFFWSGGRLDLAVPGEPVRPIIEVASLVLRRIERLGDLAWNVIDWEASMYRHLDGGAWLEPDEKIVNPHTGRKVRPLNYRERPVRFRFTDQEPRILRSRHVTPKTGKPFSDPWKVVAGDLYMVKSSYIRAPTDFAHTATSGWLPWMQMGATPGHVVWGGSGKKLFSLDAAPTDQVERLRRVHPSRFARPEPWPEFTNMYLQYIQRAIVR